MPAAGTICQFAYPLTISTLNRAIRVTVEATTETLSLVAGTYWWLYDGTAYDACKVLETALNTHTSTPGFVVTMNADGSLNVLANKAWTIKFADVATTFNSLWAGFHSSDATGVLSSGKYRLSGAHQCGFLWCPERQYSDDTGLKQDHLISRSIDVAGNPTTYKWGTTYYRSIFLDILPNTKIFTADGDTNEGFDLFYAYLATGGRFVWTPNIDNPAVYTTWFIKDQDWLETFPVVQMAELSRYYKLTIPMLQTTFGV